MIHEIWNPDSLLILHVGSSTPTIRNASVSLAFLFRHNHSLSTAILGCRAYGFDMCYGAVNLQFTKRCISNGATLNTEYETIKVYGLGNRLAPNPDVVELAGAIETSRQILIKIGAGAQLR